MKTTINRMMDLSAVLDTPAGQQIQEALTFLMSASEQSIRALNSNITFGDNIKSKTRDLQVKHLEETVMDVLGDQVLCVLPGKVQADDPANCGFSSLAWYVTPKNQLALRCGFLGTPTKAITCSVVIIFI